MGGGLGAVPHQAQLLEAFVPEEELLPLAQAVCRVFARLGEKKNRARARLKFLVAKLGIEEFRRLVLEERAILPEDPRWTAYLNTSTALTTSPHALVVPSGQLPTLRVSGLVRDQCLCAAATWLCRGHRLPPSGDITSQQMRARGHRPALQRRAARTTVAQNIVLRWISQADLRRSTRTLSRQNWDRVGLRPWRISPPARGRIPVSWASPPPGVGSRTAPAHHRAQWCARRLRQTPEREN